MLFEFVLEAKTTTVALVSSVCLTSLKSLKDKVLQRGLVLFLAFKLLLFPGSVCLGFALTLPHYNEPAFTLGVISTVLTEVFVLPLWNGWCLARE